MAAILDFLSERFLLFFTCRLPRYILPSYESTGLSFQQKKYNIDFQDDCHYGHLGIPIETILAIFDLQVALIPPTKFQVYWPFSSGEEAQNRFSRWHAE